MERHSDFDCSWLEAVPRTFEPGQLAIPEIVRRRALNLGEEGLRWLGELDDIVSGLATEWGLVIGSMMGGGSEAFVAEVVTAEGVPAVLKVGVPGSDSGRLEALVLEAAAGKGYAKLFRNDGTRRAMLVERLGPRLSDLGRPVEEQMRIICATLRTAWCTTPAGLTLMTGAEKAASLADFITATWDGMRDACSERVIERALAYAGRRRDAFRAEDAVLGHGDAHASNTLQVVGTDVFRFIDPEPLFIERAYDLSVSIRSSGAELLAGDATALGWQRAAFLGSLTGVETAPIWEWGFIERVSTGLLLKQLGSEAEGAEYLRVAEVWAVADGF